MSWELFKQLYPSGAQTELGFMTADKLQKASNINVINVPENTLAREMVIGMKDYIIGKDNEFAIGTTYNVYNETQHPDKYACPLNVYGQAMLNNYLYFHPEINI